MAVCMLKRQRAGMEVTLNIGNTAEPVGDRWKWHLFVISDQDCIDKVPPHATEQPGYLNRRSDLAWSTRALCLFP